MRFPKIDHCATPVFGMTSQDCSSLAHVAPTTPVAVAASVRSNASGVVVILAWVTEKEHIPKIDYNLVLDAFG